MSRVFWCGCCLAAWLSADGRVLAGVDDGGGGWCRTFERWAAKHPPAEGGGCPIQGECDIPEVRDPWVPDASTPIVTIRIMLHVFAEDDGSNPVATPEEVAAQLAHLNADALPSRIQFEAVTEFVHSTEFRFFSPNEEFAMKLAYAVSPETQMNVYVVDNSGGYSVGTFPWDPDALTFMGGIIMDDDHFGPGRSIMIHEVGHNIGLWHTHHGVSEVGACSPCYELAESQSDTTGDFASDTDPTPVNFFCGPPGGTDSCSGNPWGTTHFRNFMGYAPDSCTDHFSQHQNGRAHCWFNQVLTGWLCQECVTTGACCVESAPGLFACSDVLMEDCDGSFFGSGTACDDLGPGADRCDCNSNGVVDTQDISDGISEDCTGNAIPDECEPDCNSNQSADSCDIADGTSEDCNDNGIPDECDPDEDCNKNGIRDICEIGKGLAEDCNGNYVPDECDIAEGTSDDCNENAVPDECEPDCNGNEIADECDISGGTSSDSDGNGIPDECQRIIFVASGAVGANDGNDWDDAFVDLQAALEAASVGDQIRVGQGTYKPTSGSMRSASFVLLDGVAIYGGFAGPGAADPGARNPSVFQSVLSGDLIGDDQPGFINNEENCFSVVSSVGNDETTVLDGFTIRGGNANGAVLPYDAGGGMRVANSRPLIAHCTFEGNSAVFGGGMENFADGDSIVIDCVFRGNRATNKGGGMHNNGSSPMVSGCDFIGNYSEGSGGGMRSWGFSVPVVRNCRFLGNWASYGGGMVNDESDAELFGCEFSGNTASTTSAGMHNWASNPVIKNCSFNGNTASGAGGGMFNLNGSQAVVTNCVFWQNRDQTGTSTYAQITTVEGDDAPVVRYSCIQGGWPDDGKQGNIAEDPLFLDANGADDIFGTTDDDVRLFRDSPCVDAGDPGPLPGGGDLDGHARVLCGRIDMGPYEFGAGDFNCDDRVDVYDFGEWGVCVTGAGGGPYEAGCESFDLDADMDVDWADSWGFQLVYLGGCDVVITEDPIDTLVCEGFEATFEVAAEAPSGGSISYQWRVDGVDLVGANGASLLIESALPADSGWYRCVVSTDCGWQAFSSAAELVVTDPPTEMQTHPIGGTFCVGDTIFLFAGATSFPTYQWFKDGQSIDGATDPFMTIPSAAEEDAGVYHVVATNGCNSVASNEAVVTMITCGPGG